MAFIVALETIFSLSKARYGLSDGSTRLRYVVSYGTTGVLTVTLAFWTRVEYSMLRLAPWLKLRQTKSSEKALFVDYLDMWKLRVPYKALKAHDYHAAAATTASLLLNITIVISTSLFVLSDVEIPDCPEILSLRTTFIDDASRLKNVSIIPFYLTATLNPNRATDFIDVANTDFEYPFGLASHFAYQEFTPHATGASEMKATVDGFSSGSSCQEAVIGNVTGLEMVMADDRTPDFQSVPTIEVKHEGCSTTLFLPIADIEESKPTGTKFALVEEQVRGFTSGKCGSWDDDSRRMIIASVETSYTLSRPTNLQNQSGILYTFSTALSAGAALVCVPTYEIVQMDVGWVTGETPVVVSRHPNAISRTLPHVGPWDIMDAILESYELAAATKAMVVYINDTKVECDDVAGAVLESEGAQFCSAPASLLDITVLEEMFTSYYQKYSAAVVYVNLMEQTDGETTGVSKRTSMRLVVHSISAQTMAAILMLCMTIALGMAAWPAGRLSSSYEAGSIVSVAAMVGSSLGTTFPRHLGPAKVGEIEASLVKEKSHVCKQHQHLHTSDVVYTPKRQTGSHSPTVLQPLWRVMLLLMLISLFVTLEITLRKSGTNEGLGPANSDFVYLHYAWTIFPAIVLSLMSTWLSSVDSQIRIWAPFVLLGHNKPQKSVLTMDLLRDVCPVVLYQEFRARHFGAFAVTKSALIGSVFTIATAPLFYTSYFPVLTPMQLRTSTTFHNYSQDIQTFPLTSLILENNLSYQNTAYETLVLPKFVLEDLPRSTTRNSLQASGVPFMRIRATVPALRPGLICRHLHPGTSDTTRWIDDDGTNTSAWNQVVNEACDRPSVHDAGAHLGGSSVTYFGASTELNCNGQRYPGWNHDFAYVWGRGVSSLDYPTDSAGSVMECNTTLESLDVVVHYWGPNLVVDEREPPWPIESSVRRIPDPRNRSLVDSENSSMFSLWIESPQEPRGSLTPPNKTVMDPFFQQLVTSRYAIPLDYIGDPAQVAAVENAIIFQHGIFAAQFISRNLALNVSFESGAGVPNVTLFPTLSIEQDDVVDTGVYKATALYIRGAESVGQDRIATRLLQALLLATFALTLAGWLLGAWKPVLPRPPTSIASVLALLAGGDVLEHMYGGGKGDCLTLEEAMSRFCEDCSFRLGWGRGNDDGPDAPQRFGIWVVQN